MKRCTIILLFILFAAGAYPQLNIQTGSRINIGQGAFMVATGNVLSAVSFTGNGTLLLKGAALQQVDMNGVSITNLTVDNPANITLLKAARIGSKLVFVSGKILPGNNSLYLSDTAVVTGAGTGKFVETNGTGQLRKNLTKNVTNYLMPVGAGTNYAPVVISTSGTYSAANVGVYNKGTADPNKPASVTNYLNTYWGVTRTGVTGTVTAVATYNAGNVVGNEATYKGYLRSGTSFTTTGASINTTTNKITGNITGTGYAMYAMSPPPAAASKSVLDELGARPYVEQLYPNPASSECIISLYNDLDEAASINIYDIAGRMVMQRKIELVANYYQYRLDVSRLKAGIYQVQVVTELHARSFDLIKK